MKRLAAATLPVPLALVVLLAAAPARADLAVAYALGEGSDQQVGCFGPCLCPVLMRGPLKGSFDLAFEREEPPYRLYRVSAVDWFVPGADGGVSITGSGSYLVGGAGEPEQRMELDLLVGDSRQRYDSGLVPGGGTFPEISIDLAVHRFYCWDSVLTVRAAPAPTAGAGTADPRPGLRGALPSPFTSSTVVAFELERAAVVDLGVFDVRGRQVRALARGLEMGPGPHRLVWDGRDDAGTALRPGVYHLRLRAGGRVETAVVIKAR